MKRIWNSRNIGMAALCCGLGLVMTDLSLAQQPAATQLQQQQQQQLRQRQQQQRQQQQGERASTQQKEFCLASKVIGMHVKAKGEEQVGEIRNLVINRDGQVQYLAVSTSGADKPRAQILKPDRSAQDRTAAATGKLTLVPWQLVKMHEGETAEQTYAAIDIEKDRLMEAPSFTEQQLTASTGQMQLTAQVDQFFNVRTQRGAARPELDSDRQQQQQQQDRPRGILPRNDETPRNNDN